MWVAEVGFEVFLWRSREPGVQVQPGEVKVHELEQVPGVGFGIEGQLMELPLRVHLSKLFFLWPRGTVPVK